MKKEINREDERKLYEAYEVLDRLVNEHSTFTTIFNEEINKVFDEIQNTFAHIVPMIYAVKKEWQLYELEKKLEDTIEKMRKESLK